MHVLQIIFFTVIAFIIPANAMLSLRGRTITPLLYSGVILCVGLLELVSLEAARDYLENPPALRSLFGGAAAVLASFFWDRLLLLKVHAPRGRYAVFIIGGLLLIPGLLNQWPGADVKLFNRMQAWLGLLYMPAILATGWLALRTGYRPALYSAIGLSVNIAFALVHVGVLLDVLPRNVITRHALQCGFLGQFLFFMISLSSRAALMQEAGGEDEGIRRYEDELSRKRESQKYEKSKLTAVDTEDLRRRLLHLMDQERLYCDEDLNLERLAAHCKVTRHELSEYLNNRMGMNFNRFVNDYRVREACELLRNQPERSVLDIAFASGFNSKTRFNIEFKRVTGGTPREFRNRAADSPT